MSRVASFLESPVFRTFIVVLIVINAAILGTLTYQGLSEGTRAALLLADKIILAVFVVELLAKLIVFRAGFFRENWNIFDLVVVSISLIPGSDSISILRALRILRVLRLLHIVPTMRRISVALLKALPGMGAITAVLALIIYVSAVMATTMYGHTDDPEVASMFGDLPSSAFTLFQVMTLDGWRNEVVQIVMEDGNPYAWVFFLIFIFLASFAIFNLFIALIVEALQAEQEAYQDSQIEHLEETAEHAHEEREEILSTLRELKAEVAALRQAQTGPDV